MKKLGLIIAAFALVLGLSQCNKPNIPTINNGNGFTGVKRTITFSANSGDGSKSLIDNSIAGKLGFKWQSDDALYVFGTECGNFAEDGKFCGKMGLVSSPGNVNGEFEGEVEVPTGDNAKLRFYYLGGGFTEIKESEVVTGITVNIDLSAQNGDLNVDGGLQKKIMAMDECNASDYPEYEGQLDVQFAIVQFDLTDFAGEKNAVMKGIKYNKLSIDDNGNIVKTEGSNTKLDKTKLAEDAYYVAIIADDVNKLDFIGNECIGSKIVETGVNPDEFVNGVFYTDKVETNASVEVKGAKLLLPGYFSVSDTHQVQFSKGNMWWGPKNSGLASFNIEDDQLGGETSWNTNHVSHFMWYTMENITKSYGESYVTVSTTTTDILFTNNTANTPNVDFEVEGVKGIFRTLSGTTSTPQREADYLLKRRMKTDDTKMLYGCGILDGNKGFFLFPDDWNYSDWSTFKYGEKNYNSNELTDMGVWATLEAKGAVFIKEGGNRNGTTIEHRDEGKYLLSNTLWSYNSFAFQFDQTNGPIIIGEYGRNYGRYLRLVVDVD